MNSTDRKVVIFDFDGTLADTFDLTLESLVGYFSKKNRFNFDQEYIDELRDLPTAEVIKKLHISKLRLIFYIKRFQRVISTNITKAPPFEGIREFLYELKDLDFELFVLTSNSVSNVTSFLNAHNIDVFKKVYSVTNIFGKSRNILEIIKKEGFSKENVVYVGDETRDIDASKKAGVNNIAVTWGFNTRVALEKVAPDHIVDSVNDLKNVLLNKVF